MTHPSHALTAQGIWFSYIEEKWVLERVDLVTQPGELIAILGPNGSGKTTLLRCLLGLLTPQRGAVLLDDQPLSRMPARTVARKVAYVPQIPTSAFAFTVRQIVLMGRFAHAGFLGMHTEQDAAVARLAMHMTETTQLGARTLDELSGGEAQRVMMARALAQQPSVMLLDEPTSHLDLKNQVKIMRMLERLAHDWNMTVLTVSHDINQAARYVDRLVLMHQGRIAAQGPPQEVLDRDLLSRVYDMEVELLPSPDGLPLVKPW